MERSLEQLRPRLDSYVSREPETVWQDAHEFLRDDLFALSAFDMAFHDLRSRQLGLPLYKTWGLIWEEVPPSSYTIGIDSIETMVAKLDERPGWPIYKIKLGTDHDLEIVRALRNQTEARFRVDANCGWTAEQTVARSRELYDLGVEFMEQPLPPTAARSEALRVRRDSVLPVIADEDCQNEDDVARCSETFHGINVKICKCGGLTPALRMLRHARRLGLKTMVGCMVETSIGISAAAHLLPLLDYADLDGAVLLKDDPATGVTVVRGEVRLSERPGSGAAFAAT